jgi:hypothetical protein
VALRVIQEPERAPGPSRRDISIWKLLCGDARICISGVAGSERGFGTGHPFTRFQRSVQTGKRPFLAYDFAGCHGS